MKNWDLIGHEWAVQMLKQHLKQNNIRHAYLFTGPMGVGKRSLALRFAMALSCKNRSDEMEPCGTCRTCRQIESMQYVDLTVVQAETVGGVLKIDQIREMQHILQLTPYEGGYRFALILRIHEANQSGQNALLKTLEEAPDKVVLLLTAEVGEQLLPTIVSRCELFRLRPVAYQPLESQLQTRFQIDPEKSKFLAHLSAGKPGLAINYLTRPELLEERRKYLDELLLLINSTNGPRMMFAYDHRDRREKMRKAIYIWSSFWRDVMMRSSGSQAPLVNLDYSKQIDWLAQRVSTAKIQEILAGLSDRLQALDSNVNVELLTGVLLLDLPHLDIKDAVLD